MILRQLHRTAQKEGRLPGVLHVGADNTPKESKNTTMVSFTIFLLCALKGTNLRAVEYQYPLVGHTHGGLDRFFSRLIVSLRGRTYYTLSDLADVSSKGLKGFSINWNHHGSSYDWTYVRKAFGLEFHRYRNVHALRLELDDGGLWVKWKQYVTDETWSKPRLLVEPDRIATYGRIRPPLIAHDFEDKNKYYNFLDRLEALLC
eukprot:Skav222707  [mRNA]  locus=scaffold402:633342:633950:- [translate_table: standard]